MMKNGATPDVVTFIETTIAEINQNVLGQIVDEHNRDQALIDSLLARFDVAVSAMEAACAALEVKHNDRMVASLAHKECRSIEALDCARSRRCEEELEHLWSLVRLEETEMRRIHWAIHGEWCLGSAPDFPSLADPFHWTVVEYKEGAETSESVNQYPAVDLETDVIEFRRFSVDYFGHYIVQKPRVELAWLNYNNKLVECRNLEVVLEDKVEVCDEFQIDLHDKACDHVHSHRQSAANYGHEYHMTMLAYNDAVTAIQQLEHDRKREWETLHITTCLLETVYTHVIHSIDSGDPCPTTTSHPNETAAAINFCHVVEESLTANLTIDYGVPPEPVVCTIEDPGPCSAQYIWDDHGSFPQDTQTSHSAALAADEGLANYFTTLSVHGWAGCAAPRACIPCDVPDLIIDANYVSSDVCKEHQEYLRPGQMDYDSFKCQSGDQCILAVGRCNGESNCDDGSDEVGCETNWGIPAILHNEECDEPFISDLQFRCADNACTHIEGRCNGINNCADGSDEESCSSLDLKRDLIIEATTGFSASVETLTAHSEVFYDRNYVFNSLGSFSGHSYIKMSNEDKHTPHSHVQMKLRSPAPLTVYIVRNSAHALPWLHSDGWSISDLQGVSYQGTRSTPHKEWATDNVANYEFSTDHFPEAPWISEVWQKTFPAGIVELRGDGGDGSYLIFVANVVTPPTPPTLDLWDQHLEDHHKCNNNIDVQYVSSQQACQQLAVANGHEFYSFRHNAGRTGHKCMSSATCDSPLDDRTNEWNIYRSIPGAGQYVGCFKDDRSRDLGAMVGNTNAATNTFQGCRAACGDHQYMSLQYGGECFCANSYGNGPQYTQVDDGLCNSISEPCFSNSFNCGGTWHQAIYQINPVTTAQLGFNPHANTKCPQHNGDRIFREPSSGASEINQADCFAQCQSTEGCNHFSWGQYGGGNVCMGCTTLENAQAHDGFTAYDMTSAPVDP